MIIYNLLFRSIFLFKRINRLRDNHSINGALAVRAKVRVHLMVVLHHRFKVALLARLTVYPDLVCALCPAGHAFSSESHEVTSTLTMEYMLAFQSNRTS